MSPRAKARLAGAFEALEGFPAAFGQVFVFGTLVVAGNAAATARNILAHEALFRFGFAVPLLAVGFHIAWALLFYQLFKPVNRTVNLLATFVSLAGCAIQAMAADLYLTPLLILKGGSSLGAFTAAQQQSLALASVDASRLAFDVYLIFFGFWCVLTGYLIFRSTFLPRILGVLLALDGLGWMTYLWPPVANSIYPVIAAVSGLAEFSLILWLLVFGVNTQRWKEQSGTAGRVDAGWGAQASRGMMSLAVRRGRH
jgi:hypothetical protein